MSGPMNYTTKVPVTRTVGEVTGILAGHGASEISTMYDEGKPIGLRFTVRLPDGQEELFRLPVLIDGVHKLLQEKVPRSAGPRATTVEQAERVAWRQIKDWVEAQMAIIESGMATLLQVMLPYLQVDQSGTTLYQAFLESGRRQIE